MFIRLGLLLAAGIFATAARAADCDLNHLNSAALENVAVIGLPSSELGEQTPSVSGSKVSTLVESLGSAIPSGGEVLGYTRLRLVFTPCERGQLRHYGKESRSSIERFFVGKVDNHVLKFDADVEPTGVKTSSQLYSMLRDSSKDGQSWTTDIRNNDFLLPYFRVDTSSILNFTANFQSEGSSKFDIGGSVLDIIEQGAKLITPTAVLITDANRSRFNDAANFVDGSLSKLFYKKVTETARQGIAIRPTESGMQHLARVILIDPDPTKTFITADRPGRVIGQWDIYADVLKKSLFAPVRFSEIDVSNLDPATVLNFKIGDKEVLRDRFASSDAIAKAAQALAKADSNNAGGPAISLCRLVAMESAKVGLSPHDMAIAAWAFLADQAMVGKKNEVATTACLAVRHFPHEPTR